MAAKANSAIFFVSCMVTFLERTRPASSMAKPAAIENTKKPATRNMKVVKIKPISWFGGVTSASWARPSDGRAISAAAAPSLTANFMVISFPQHALQRILVGFAGPHTQRLLQIKHEYLSIADLAGLGGLRDGIHHLIGHSRLHRDFQFDFRHEIHRVLCTTVDFGVARLRAKAFDFGHHHAAHADRG